MYLLYVIIITILYADTLHFVIAKLARARGVYIVVPVLSGGGRRGAAVEGLANIGADIEFIAEQRKHHNAIMSLLVLCVG